MKRRDFLRTAGLIAGATALVPSIEPAQANAIPTEDIGLSFAKKTDPRQEQWRSDDFGALVAACAEQGHVLMRHGWTFQHMPYGMNKQAEPNEWSVEVLESLDIGDASVPEAERFPIMRGWLMGVHMLEPAIPRIPGFQSEDQG